MALNSPGVQVQVIDESFYVPAEPGTRPLLIVTTQENKSNASGTGIAIGTLASNAGKPYLISSQRDLTETFGSPLFYKDSSQNPIHGGELNEYGLQAAYSYLGVSNSAWVIRSDLDLGQLVPLAEAPGANPAAGTYWLDVQNTRYGIFEWDGDSATVTGGQKFANKVPLVITDVTQLQDDDPTNPPKVSIGAVGTYAVVSTTTMNKVYYKNRASQWVQLGTPEWNLSWPVVKGSQSNPVINATHSMVINGTTVTAGGTTITALAAAINTANIQGVTAAVVDSRLEIYSDGTVDSGLGDSTRNNEINIGAGVGTLVATTIKDSSLGIVIGTYYGPYMQISPHTSVPRFKRIDPAPRPSGSVWIKTTDVQLGARWRIKLWNDQTLAWESVEAPLYKTGEEAIYKLDRAYGGDKIPTGTLFIKYNFDEDTGQDSTPRVASFKIFRREKPSPTNLVSKPITAGTFDAQLAIVNVVVQTNVATLTTETNHTYSVGDIVKITLSTNTVLNGYATITAVTNNTFSFAKTTGNISTGADSGSVKKKYSFSLAETQIGVNGLAPFKTISLELTGSVADAAAIAERINAAIYQHVEASVDSKNRVVISHRAGGDMRLRDADGTLLAMMGFVAYDITNSTGTANLYADPTTPAYDDEFPDLYRDWYIGSLWKPLKVIPSMDPPIAIPDDGRLWYTSIMDEVDIMIHNGSNWVGYLYSGGNNVNNASPFYDSDELFRTDPMGPIVSASKPASQSDGTLLRNGDLWIDSGDVENYPALYKFDGFNLKWIPVDTADQVSEDGIIFADARYNTNGKNSNIAGTIEDLLTSNFVDVDAPDPDLYPRGMLLFNTRRSGYNVKRFIKDYINTDADNIRFNNGESMFEYYPHRWVNESGNAADGRGLFGRKAQRKVVVKHLKALTDTNQVIRDNENITFNLMACPGYCELIQNMVALNIDRNYTAFVIGDSPFRLTPDSTTLYEWGSNMNQVVDNGDSGLFSRDEYLGVYYPSGYTTSNTGDDIVVPASHMVLRTIALSDNVSYPWFAPAGTRRGGITNVNSVGYVGLDGEFKVVALNEGQRDVLYSVSVNPLTYLTGVGNVVFGQKTRAKNASSLDRINVARLVVYMRGQLNKLAKPYIFEPNDKITRDEIKAAAESLLLELVGQRALYDYLVVCDESNNTPLKIDRNELYLDIAIEPVKAVEFIYIPLRLKNTGEIKGL
jgi:hypothetical protein